MIQGANTINFLPQLGGAIGIRLTGIVLDWRLALRTEPLLHAAVQEGRLQAFNETLLLVAELCALAVPAPWRMRPEKAKHLA